jgi:hypothetical protein
MTERNEPVDRRHEEALSAALHTHADTVRPAGDGLVRIRSRVAHRRRRVRFLAPLASVAAAAAAVTAIVASGLLTSPAHHTTIQADSPTAPPPAAPHTTTRPAVVPTSSQPSTAPSASFATPASTAPVITTSATLSASPTGTEVAAAGHDDINPPVWPFADATAATTWQQTLGQKTSEAWHLDARSVATRFVTAIVANLGLPNPQVSGSAPVVNDDGTATVDVTRLGPNSTTIDLATVTLSHWATGGGQPWGIVSAASPASSQIPMAITSPTPYAAAAAPLSVAYTLTGGAEDDDYVGVWAAGATKAASVTHPVTGTGTTVSLPTVPTSGTGFVAVADGSSASGSFGLARLAVTPVRYGASGGTVVPAAETYVAVTDKGIEVRDAATDGLVRTLAGTATGVASVAVSQDRQWVYYLASDGQCGGRVWKTKLDGTGQPVAETHWSDGLSAFGIAGNQSQWLSYVYTPCSGGSQTLFWSVGGDQLEPPSMNSLSRPPDLTSIAVAPDGSNASGALRTGMAGNVVTYTRSEATPGGPAAQASPPPAKTLTDGTVPVACRASGNECIGVAYAPNGDLVLVRSDGSRLTVVRQHGTTVTPVFSVPDSGAGQLATLDTDPTGNNVLLTDANGHGWMWNGRGQARALPGHLIDASW